MNVPNEVSERSSAASHRHARLATIAGWGLVIGALTAVGCRDRMQAAADAATDYVPLDMPAPADSAAVPLALDFSATGCTRFDPAVPACLGAAPLTIAFTPVASAELTRFLWTFGDDTPDSSERSPVHTYTFPGQYRVTLVALASSGSSLQQSHAAFVQVGAAAAGGACDVDAQCGGGDARCWCGSQMPCSPYLARGFCAVACDSLASGTSGAASCPADTTCVDLSATNGGPPAPSSRSGWRRPICLPTCSADSECGREFRCRSLRAGAPVGGWTRACFGDYPLAIGARCGDGQSGSNDGDCASRVCSDLGAFRHCSADCTSIPCPSGSACARFGDGRRLCLAACRTPSGGSSSPDAAASTSGHSDGAAVLPDGAGAPVDAAAAVLEEDIPIPCDEDPLMACQSPGGSGLSAFTVSGPVLAPTYCSPKRCTTSADCGPSGVCPSGGGACRRVSTTP